MVRGEAKLFIGQISYEATKQDIHRIFSAYGDVVDVQVLHDKETRMSRGACFVTYGSTEEADTAIASLHDRYRMLSNRFIQVSYAKNSPNISPYGHYMAVDVASRNQSNPMPCSHPRNIGGFAAAPSQAAMQHPYNGATTTATATTNSSNSAGQQTHNQNTQQYYGGAASSSASSSWNNEVPQPSYESSQTTAY